MERKEQKIDWLTVLIYMVFILLGWLNIYAASSKDPTVSLFDWAYNGGKQFWFVLAVGLVAVIVLNLNTRLLEFSSYIFYGVSLFMLVFVMLFGREVNGAKAWLEVGSMRIQPAEFMKVATAMAVARYMSQVNFNMRNQIQLLTVVGFITLPFVLIIMQRDTGTALVFTAFVLMLFREGLSYLFMIVLLLVGIFSVLAIVLNKVLVIIAIGLLTILVFNFMFKRRYWVTHVLVAACLILMVLSIDFVVNNILKEHQRTRIYALFNPKLDPLGANWNTTQSIIAIGSGGVMGKGFLNGTQTKYDFVPQQTTDFIFCTVGEEHGWFGSVFVLGLFLVFMAQLLYVSEQAKSTYARIFGYSIASMIFFHVAVNVAMTIGLAPVIGIPLPFFSYGGSSLLSFTLMVFILLNFYSNRVNIFSTERIR